jgi:hypothetical protein
VRGKKWHYEAVYPDGRKEVILSVPRYDFNWQTYYEFETPKVMPKGTRLLASAWYDTTTRRATPTIPIRSLTCAGENRPGKRCSTRDCCSRS